MKQPTDENLARWVLANLDVPGIGEVGIQSTAHEGATSTLRDERMYGGVTRSRPRTSCPTCPRVTSVDACTAMASR